MNRTDPHRPGAIIPAEYRYVMSYNLSGSEGGFSFPAYGVTCLIDGRTPIYEEGKGWVGSKNGEHLADGNCCVVELQRTKKFAATGNTGKCSICGANFVYGDIWVHEPTGEHIHIGHTCAAKYELLADRSEYELGIGRVKAAAAKEIVREENRIEREAFLADHPGLEEALKTDHHIVKDIADRFRQYRSLSDKQVALVMKISTEAKLPPAEKEKNVPAPITEGKCRQTFTGVVVSAKSMDGAYGIQYKMTVKVTTPNGVWLAWGTIPNALLESVPNWGNQGRIQNLKGATVEVTAGLKPGRDAHFALMGRPVGKVISLSSEVMSMKPAQEVA